MKVLIATIISTPINFPSHKLFLYRKLNELKSGNGILMLKDANNDGRADAQTGFGNYTGTGIAIKNGYLYASSDDEVFRYKFNSYIGPSDGG